MSTKAKIQKVRAEVEAHEERGWLKGYEEGLAKREQQIMDLQSALEVRNETVRELSRQKKGPRTAREALALAWELAHPVREGQVIPSGTEFLLSMSDGFYLHDFNAVSEYTANNQDETYLRTLDPLPDPEPDWLDAPAVIASHPIYADTEQKGIWIPSNEEGMWEWPFQQGEFMAHWTELENVTPLYPKEDK